jgi:hypothetical protein
MADMAAAAKVDNLDGGALWVLQENVFRFEVAMNHADIISPKEEEGVGDLHSKLADQVQGDAAEIGVADEVVQVVGEQLKH